MDSQIKPVRLDWQETASWDNERITSGLKPKKKKKKDFNTEKTDIGTLDFNVARSPR